MCGPIAWLLPAVAGCSGFFYAISTESAFALTSSFLFALGAIGIIDAGAGFVGALVASVVMGFRFGVSSVDELEYLLMFIGVSCMPVLAATALRPLRTDHGGWREELWERAVDLAVGAVIVMFTAGAIISALPVMARHDVGVTHNTSAIVLALGAVFVVRVALETLAVTHFPLRLSRDHPQELPQPIGHHRIRAEVLPALVLLAVGYSFIGSCWQLYCGVAVAIAGQVFGHLRNRLPAITALWRLLPGGVAGFVLSLLVASFVAATLHRIIGNTPHMARTMFAVGGIPMLGWSALKAMGRTGPEGAIHWYDRYGSHPLFRIGGVVVFFFLIRLTNVA
jgi:hypothetical protein